MPYTLNHENISPSIQNLFEKNKKVVKEFGFTEEDKESLIKSIIKNPENYTKALENLEKIFLEGEKLSRFGKNISRKKEEIADSIEKPGKIDVKDFLQRVENSIRVGSEDNPDTVFNQKNVYKKHASSSKLSKFGDKDIPFYQAIIGGKESEIEGILNDNESLVKGNILSTSYVENVLRAEAKLKCNKRGFAFKAKSFFENGEFPSDKEVKDHEENPLFSRRVAENIVKSSSKILNALGKGILSSTKATETSGYKNYLSNRNKALAGLAARTISNPQDGTAHIQHLKSINALLKNSSDPEDQATYKAMEELLNKEMKEIEETNSKALASLEGNLNTLNDKTTKELQEHVDKQDEAWKIHVLCAFLAVSPFSPALLVAGPLFNIMGPITQILGPVLMPTQGLAHGIASISSNPALGPIGDLFGLMKVDVGVEFLLNNVPIVSNLTEMADFLIDNPLTQGVLETSSPLFTSALFMTGIAATACFYDATDTYLRHYEDGKGKSPFLKKQKDSLKTIVGDCESDIKNNLKKEIKELAGKMYNTEKAIYIKHRLSEEGILNEGEIEIKIEELSQKFILKKALELGIKTQEELEVKTKEKIKKIIEKSDLEALEKSVIFAQAKKIELLTSTKGSDEIPNPSVSNPRLSKEFRVKNPLSSVRGA